MLENKIILGEKNPKLELSSYEDILSLLKSQKDIPSLLFKIYSFLGKKHGQIFKTNSPEKVQVNKLFTELKVCYQGYLQNQSQEILKEFAQKTFDILVSMNDQTTKLEVLKIGATSEN